MIKFQISISTGVIKVKNQNYKLVAPDIDRLLKYFDRGYLNPSGVRPALAKAMEPLFELLSPLAPLEDNDEAKFLWLFIPRGDISDYDSFEDLKEYGEVKTYKEYEELWKYDYPQEKIWYQFVIVDSKDSDGTTRFRAVALGNKTIISAEMKKEGEPDYSDEAAVMLCNLITPAVKESLDMLKNGTYNDFVNKNLPYKFRTGIIKRSVLWKYNSERRQFDFDGLSEETISTFRNILKTGVNDKTKISRIKNFTANDFFKACELGYKALNYDTKEMSLSELYLEYADGRDEGLTGKGCGLNEGPGIDFEDSKAWDEWYSRKNMGGHPWEIIRGGNSTHLDLMVCNDKRELEYEFRLGEISEEEYKERLEKAGYYFTLRGKYRQLEAVTFYTTLSAAGLPVILEDAEEILARFEGNDYVGIVPHSCATRYCESMFPSEYGKVIDFIHVFDEDMEQFGKEITWLPEDAAKLI